MSCRLRHARCWGWVWLVLVCSSAREVHAHPTPGSVALLDLTVDGARLEQDVPIEELERALHRQLFLQGDAAERCVARHAAMLGEYASQHLRVTAQDGAGPWTVEVLGVEGYLADDGPRARFRFALHAPAAEVARPLVVHDDLVAHEVISHYTQLYVRSDFSAGWHAGEPQLAGVIHAGQYDVSLARSGSFWRGLGSVLRLGMQHIATGTDHLLFLLALILVAPLAAIDCRWRGRRDTRQTFRALLALVSAFTVGHSTTLALGALGWVSIPPAAVEVAIALSVLLTAAHAMRPLFARREVLIAGLFGLVHGLAFASTLTGRDLGTAQALWTLFGFNLGIELAQLGILFLVVPWIVLASRTRAYDGLRSALATITGVLALCWLLERTTSVPNPAAVPLAWLEAHPVYALLALALCALAARALEPQGQAEAARATSS